ncbi:MAG: hypothetical protein Q4E22_04345 [Coriobacteriia bacterium]|nr:hypothetical protein [Coriobacteriia bacterium]
MKLRHSKNIIGKTVFQSQDCASIYLIDCNTNAIIPIEASKQARPNSQDTHELSLRQIIVLSLFICCTISFALFSYDFIAHMQEGGPYEELIYNLS